MESKKGYLTKDQRKKVLLLCDDIRYQSGIGTMAREIVEGTVGTFNWVVLGALSKHPEQGKRFDLSADISNRKGVEDVYVHLIPYSGYGDSKILRTLLKSEKPDAVMIFTDPRYWIWLFEMEREIRTQVPLVYLNIWDNYPAPMYNKPYYESCDVLMSISKQTFNINKLVLGDKVKDKVLRYVPHGIDHTKFYPISKTSQEYLELQSFRKQLGIPENNFTILWNSRNITRKHPADVIESFNIFVQKLDLETRKKVTLVMHTDPVDANGTDLFAVKEAICDADVDIRFTPAKFDNKQMNFLYNIADVSLLISSNEGWGLSVTESLMAGTMVIGNVTGGIQDQMRFEDREGNWIDFNENLPSLHKSPGTKCGVWAIPVFPSNISLMGSINTPYIYDDRCSAVDVANAIAYAYSLTEEARTERGLLGREWVRSGESKMSAQYMCQGVIHSIEEGITTFKPRSKYDLHKVEEIAPKKVPHSLEYGKTVLN